MKNQRTIIAGFLLSLIFLAVTVYLSHSFFEKYTIKDKEESYVFTVIVKIDDLHRSLRDENAAQRQYLSSNNPSDLDRYADASKKVNLELAELYALTANNQVYQQRLAVIAPLIHARQKALDEGIETGVRSESLRTLIREILDRVFEMRSHALEEMRNYSAVLQKHLIRIRLMLMINSMFVAVLFSMVFWLMKRDIAHRSSEEAELKLHRDRLDELVLCRTEELVTANQRLQTEMEVRKQAEKLLRNLNDHMEVIREEERTVISRDIHDEIGQSLTALKLDIALMEHTFLPGNSKFIERLNGMKSSLDRLIGKVQNIMSELRPPLLDSLGLNEAIDWQICEFKRRTAMDCRLKLDPKVCALDKKSATVIMRILMEALTNITRHAHATIVSIFLGVRGENIELEISDNGCGITSDELASPSSYGLMGMQERARLCNGILTVTGAPGQGTTVCLHLPPEQLGSDCDTNIAC